MARKKRPLADRLLERVHMAENGCWLWLGAVINSGYGVCGLGGRRSQVTAHRAAAVAWLGMDPNSPLVVCHRCDNKLCVNPTHLFIGTQQDNIDDMWSKGRGPDQRHPKKLTLDQAQLIRREYASGEYTNRSLAAKHGLGKSTIQSIVTNKIWKVNVC